MNKIIEYIISAKDATGGAIASALAGIKAYANTVGTVLNDTLTRYKDGFAAQLREMQKADDEHWKMVAAVEAQKRAQEKAKREQEEYNAALQRYCQLCEQAKRAEADRLSRSMSKGWNGAENGSQYDIIQKRAQGAETAKTSLEGLARSAKQALPAMAAVSSSIGMMEGEAGKIARAVSGIASMTLAFGPLGAAIGAVQASISLLASHFIEKADAMLAKTKEWAAGVAEKCKIIREQNFNRFIGNLERVTKAVERSASAFDRMAAAAKAMRDATNRIADAKGESEIADMEAELAQRVTDAPEEEKARVNAAGRLEIAQRTAELTKESAERAAASERAELETMRKKVELAERNANRLADAKDKAQAEYNRVKDIYGIGKDESDRYKKAVDAAEDRLESALNNFETLRGELAAMEQNLVASDIERKNEVSRAFTETEKALNEYKNAESSYAKAIEKKTADAAKEEEKTRLDIEKKIEDAKEKEWKKYVAMVKRDVADWSKEEQIANARLQKAQENERTAWGWYRDRDSWKAQLQEERDNAAAEKQFEKDFEKLKSRKSDWRTAKLNDDDELIRRVALAREEKKAAEDYARQTAEYSKMAADALASIEEIMEGE